MAATRRIVMFNWMTADGFFTAADGNLDWVVPDDEQTKAAVASMPNADTLLLGRKTYEMFAAFWPHALNDSGTCGRPHPRVPSLQTLRLRHSTSGRSGAATARSP